MKDADRERVGAPLVEPSAAGVAAALVLVVVPEVRGLVRHEAIDVEERGGALGEAGSVELEVERDEVRLKHPAAERDAVLARGEGQEHGRLRVVEGPEPLGVEREEVRQISGHPAAHPVRHAAVEHPDESRGLHGSEGAEVRVRAVVLQRHARFGGGRASLHDHALAGGSDQRERAPVVIAERQSLGAGAVVCAAHGAYDAELPSVREQAAVGIPVEWAVLLVGLGGARRELDAHRRERVGGHDVAADERGAGGTDDAPVVAWNAPSTEGQGTHWLGEGVVDGPGVRRDVREANVHRVARRRRRQGHLDVSRRRRCGRDDGVRRLRSVAGREDQRGEERPDQEGARHGHRKTVTPACSDGDRPRRCKCQARVERSSRWRSQDRQRRAAATTRPSVPR